MEVAEQSFISVESSMDVELIVVDSRCMIRSGSDVLAFDFDFCPAQVEGVFEVGFDSDVGRLSLIEVFILPKIVRLFQFHKIISI